MKGNNEKLRYFIIKINSPQLFQEDVPTAIATPKEYFLCHHQQPERNFRRSETPIITVYCFKKKSISAWRTSCENATADTPTSNSPIPNTYNVCNVSVLQILMWACVFLFRPAFWPDATISLDGCKSILKQEKKQQIQFALIKIFNEKQFTIEYLRCDQRNVFAFLRLYRT